jgi:CTP synthase
VTIALVGKYVELHDSYLSIKEALYHAGYATLTKITIKWVHAEEVTQDTATTLLGECDGILIPGGFGMRAVEGKIIASQWAYQNKVPYFGICLGMQVMCIGLARQYIDPLANSLECDPETPTPIITVMKGQQDNLNTGGTMRLGKYPCKLIPATRVAQAYQDFGDMVYERHRHRFEFNNIYRNELEKHGLVFSGVSPDGSLVEIVEIKDHPFMVASQFHPEFLSRPTCAHPLFVSFVQAMKDL